MRRGRTIKLGCYTDKLYGACDTHGSKLVDLSVLYKCLYKIENFELIIMYTYEF